MLRINQIKMGLSHNNDDLRKKVLKILKISPDKLLDFQIIRKSIDARDKSSIKYIYTVDVSVKDEKSTLQKVDNKYVMSINQNPYTYPVAGNERMRTRPVICGSGPSGLFAAYYLARAGYEPIILEQGEPVEERVRTVANFWKTGKLNPNSNVQFGEGGAGTFSDGKLNTLIKDKSGRNHQVLKTFVENGASEEILYNNKPHIGTDMLRTIVKTMREQIIAWGGEFRFSTKLTDLVIRDGILSGITLNNQEFLDCETLILAIGHSSRETFRMLHQRNLSMTNKAFAVGIRIEHPQEMISRSQYGSFFGELPPAEYKLTSQTTAGRSVYTFCMCPGGYVVNSSSEPGGVVVNGMSNSKRNSPNANSAIIVSVDHNDFSDDSPLAGMHFARALEEKAFAAGNGKIPVQLLEDFLCGTISREFKEVSPCIMGETVMADLNKIFPTSIAEALKEAIKAFALSIKGFDRPDAVLSAVESRTSSPVRIFRDETMQGSVLGVYPCGEGAGYAGGITSAAMDGIKIYEILAQRFAPFTKKE